MSSFENLRIVDNFYQTSLFFPMPTVIISTLCEDGTTNLGPYSLVQPYYVAGKDYYAMLLSCRNSSNTAQNILRNGKCALCFIDDKPATFKEAVKLSWPGDKPEEKMPKCNFLASEISARSPLRIFYNPFYPYSQLSPRFYPFPFGLGYTRNIKNVFTKHDRWYII